jgi:hypothetical protein
MESTVVIWSIVAVIAAWQLWVSVVVVRASFLERHQRVLQLCLIWFLPLIGAVVVHSMLRSEGRPPYVPEKGYTVPGDNASGPDH